MPRIQLAGWAGPQTALAGMLRQRYERGIAEQQRQRDAEAQAREDARWQAEQDLTDRRSAEERAYGLKLQEHLAARQENTQNRIQAREKELLGMRLSWEKQEAEKKAESTRALQAQKDASSMERIRERISSTERIATQKVASLEDAQKKDRELKAEQNALDRDIETSKMNQDQQQFYILTAQRDRLQAAVEKNNQAMTAYRTAALTAKGDQNTERNRQNVLGYAYLYRNGDPKSGVKAQMPASPADEKLLQESINEGSMAKFSQVKWVPIPEMKEE